MLKYKYVTRLSSKTVKKNITILFLFNLLILCLLVTLNGSRFVHFIIYNTLILQININ